MAGGAAMTERSLTPGPSPTAEGEGADKTWTFTPELTTGIPTIDAATVEVRVIPQTVFGQVWADLCGREAIGAANHGGRALDAMQPGRDWLREAYEECLDMAVYLRAELTRREAVGATSHEPPLETPYSDALLEREQGVRRRLGLPE